MAIPEPPPDPHGVLGWITAILETVKQAYAALVIPAAGYVVWLVKRKDRAQERADARQNKEDEAHQRIADQLDRESAERFEAMRAENATLRAENSRLLGLVRRWFDLAHDMRHEGSRLLARLASVLMEHRLDLPPEIKMPALSYDPDKP